MFTMKELEPFIQMAATMEINCMTFTLSNVEELSGLHAVWVSESIKVYATPYFEDIPVPVHVIDSNGKEIGMNGYTAEFESFERYCKVVQTLAAKILRRQRM